ncbi:uncharacterized protein TRAVEDRAFT_169191 [Trametes versicolor FP-101664 SS1]|uniref:uncharacterized protein n=1 Tax=Trametes versicolor (strain FP-101664) TaxID=717944 RepID=UPI00046246EC|nr:uncharacterized protein TRAVEDRAFT_169191 [Trametes versicolor FP-101664 SS1]EIW57424.1 hypothetical protein TRAVEDRAFT_169191 [Trametes versicolor FP-101664 SS1]
MPTPYAPLAGPRYAPEAAQRELDDAFDSEDEGQDSSESTPLTRSLPPRTASHAHPPLDEDDAFPSPAPTPQTAPGGYDFERDYDYDYARPPPGSPPGPSARALPNDIGNSNGQLPTAPVEPPRPRMPFWRKAVGALLPEHYVSVPTEAPGHRVVGGGTENDGVFANVSAKPSMPMRITDLDGNTHLVPEEVQKETPPSYAEAQLDAVPPYWETTVHAPAAALDPNAYMIVDELPSGSVLSFLVTAFVSFFFQFAGFVLTYLLHTTHAAKFGSRAGLGLTLIQYGLIQYGGSFGRMHGGMGPGEDGAADGEGAGAMSMADVITKWNSTRFTDPVLLNGTAGPFDMSSFNATDPNAVFELQFAVTSRDWVALILMTLGWFLLLSSAVGFYRVKRWENAIRVASLPQEPLTPEQRRHDEQVRRNIEAAFGFGDLDVDEDEHSRELEEENARRRAAQMAQMTEAELRVTRTLQAAGLL